MKKKWLGIFLCTCMTVGSLTGCSAGDQIKNAITNQNENSEKKEENPLIENADSYVELSDYSVISLKKEEIEKELQSNIDKTLEQYPVYQKIKKGKVKSGDIVNIYYVGKMDGKAFDGGSCTKESDPQGFDLEIGSNTFIDGFEKQLIDKKIGKTYDIIVTFPEEYSANPDLAGKEAVFTVTLNHKQGKKLSQKFNDAFVKKNLTDYTSVEDYKTKSRDSIRRTMAVSRVCEEAKINQYPDDKVKGMEKQLKTSIEAYLSQGNMTLDDYLKQLNTTKEDYEKQVTETAKEDVRKQLVYNAIAQAEKIKISDEEYQEELKIYLTNYNCTKESDLNDTFEKTYGATAKKIIYNDLLYQKVADYLVKNIKET